jgi:hypothetical protein
VPTIGSIKRKCKIKSEKTTHYGEEKRWMDKNDKGGKGRGRTEGRNKN